MIHHEYLVLPGDAPTDEQKALPPQLTWRHVLHLTNKHRTQNTIQNWTTNVNKQSRKDISFSKFAHLFNFWLDRAYYPTVKSHLFLGRIDSIKKLGF